MITNTTKQQRTLMDGLPAMIESSERIGQQELANSEQLPTRFINPDDKATLELAGVVFGEPTPGDPIFCAAQLPKGWVKRPTNHSMWSELVDDTGKVRAMIFYKAAFYDRDAFIVAEK